MSYMKRLWEEQQDGECGDTSYLDEEFRVAGNAGETNAVSPASDASENAIDNACNFCPSITEDSLA